MQREKKFELVIILSLDDEWLEGISDKQLQGSINYAWEEFMRRLFNIELESGQFYGKLDIKEI